MIIVLLVLIVLFRYLAFMNGYRPDPWIAYLAASLSLIASIVFFVKPPPLAAILALVAVYGIWKLAWLDAALAHREFSALCEREAGFHIYKEALIPATYFGGKHGFTFIDDATGRVIRDRLPPGFIYQFSDPILVSSRYTKIYMTKTLIGTEKPIEVFAEQIKFSAEGGGPPRLGESPQLKGSPCPQSWLTATEFMKKVFVSE